MFIFVAALVVAVVVIVVVVVVGIFCPNCLFLKCKILSKNLPS